MVMCLVNQLYSYNYIAYVVGTKLN
jgi:hypothetical protein